MNTFHVASLLGLLTVPIAASASVPASKPPSAAALQLAAPPAAPSKPLVQTTYSDGSTSVELNDDYMSEVTVQRAPGANTFFSEKRMGRQ